MMNGRYKVVMDNPGPKTIEVIKLTRKVMGLDLLSAKRTVESAMINPIVLVVNLSYEEACDLANSFEEISARMSVQPDLGNAKVGIRTLGDQVSDLETENKRLKDENARLRSMLENIALMFGANLNFLD